jgi:MFS family permease
MDYLSAPEYREPASPGLSGEYPRMPVHNRAIPARKGPLGLVTHNGRLARLTAAVLVSSTGDPFTQTVSLVLLYQATGSPVAIAAAFGAEMLGVLTVGALIGAAADRVDRRKLIVALETARFLIVASLPIITSTSIFLLYPFLFALASIEALVQPARQAAVTELVSMEDVGAANALLMTALTAAEAAGFAIAGALLIAVPDPRPLYIVDAFTFATSAVLVSTLGRMGGGIATARLSSGVRTAWSLPRARHLLVVAAATALVVGMLNPSLLPVAYVLSGNGPSAFSVLQVALIAGGFVGSLAIGRIAWPGRFSAQVAALWVFGIGVFVIGVSHNLVIAALAVALSGIGNAAYSIANNTALMEAATSNNRGTVMSARFTLTRATMAVGLGVGPALSSLVGPLRAVGFFGLGLVLVAALYSVFLAVSSPARIQSSPSRAGIPQKEPDSDA